MDENAGADVTHQVCGHPGPTIDMRKPGSSGSQLNSRPDLLMEGGRLYFFSSQEQGGNLRG